jgi:LemA protein
MAYYIIGAIVLIIAIWAGATYNSFKKLKVRIDEAFATMDVYLKKRFDLIPNLIETVKGYMSHEKETLEAVVAARAKSASANTAEERADGENELTQTLGRLFALAESYPELKADSQFTGLSQSLNSTESEIAKARTYYNAVVREFNTKREIFPSMIIASLMNLEAKKYFEAGSPEERENVKVSFK